VRQALSAALQRELTEFYGFLASLEQQLVHPLPGPGAGSRSAAARRGAPPRQGAAARLRSYVRGPAGLHGRLFSQLCNA
jgi:hypothetical protein